MVSIVYVTGLGACWEAPAGTMAYTLLLYVLSSCGMWLLMEHRCRLPQVLATDTRAPWLLMLWHTVVSCFRHAHGVMHFLVAGCIWCCQVPLPAAAAAWLSYTPITLADITDKALPTWVAHGNHQSYYVHCTAQQLFTVTAY